MTKFRALLVGVGIVVMGWASGAAAQTTTYTGTEVRGVEVQRPPGTQPSTVVRSEEFVEEFVEESSSESELPVTGGDLAGLALIGAGAVAVGGALHFRRRRPLTVATAGVGGDTGPMAPGRY